MPVPMFIGIPMMMHSLTPDDTKKYYSGKMKTI